MKILSIQSAVAYGHVGNSAAVFPLQRIGVEVLPVYTVNFSNHTGYGAWRGPLIAPDDVRDVITGIEERGVLGECDAVLSGYQGGEQVGAVILDAVARVKAANPRAIYCADPVMGDVERGFFVRPGIPEFMRDKVIPAADIVTPNQFELDYLSGTEVRTVDGLICMTLAASLLLSPRLMRRRTSISRSDSRLLRGALAEAGPPAAMITQRTASASNALACPASTRAASSGGYAGRHGRGMHSAT